MPGNLPGQLSLYLSYRLGEVNYRMAVRLGDGKKNHPQDQSAEGDNRMLSLSTSS